MELEVCLQSWMYANSHDLMKRLYLNRKYIFVCDLSYCSEFCILLLMKGWTWMLGQTLILSGGESEAAEQPSAFVKAVGVFNSLNRFMRSLSK